MSHEYLLGIDIGTSTSKGAILDFDGNIVADENLRHGVSNPKPGRFEQEAEIIWWGDFVNLCRCMLVKANIDPNKIRAVGCSTVAASFVAMDEKDRPLRPAILYGIDCRASMEIQELNTILGKERIAQTSGNNLTSQSVGPKILWFKKNEPDLYEKTRKVIPANTYLIHKLTGAYAIDHYGASTFEPLFNLKELSWDPEVLQEVGIPANLLPDIRSSSDIVGYVNETASRETGLAKGTPVITGGPDALMEMVGVGISEPDQTALVYGSTMIVLRTINEPKIDPALILRPFLFKDKYLLVGAMATSGLLINWFVKNFTQFESNETDTYNILQNKACTIPAGSEGLVVLPYFSGERTPIWDQRARGLIIGLTLSHTNAHIYRAVLEGIAYSLLHNLDRMKKIGFTVGKVRAIGGGVRNLLWTQIVSDVTGLHQDCILEKADAHMGAAYLAGYGVGVFDDFKPLRNRWVKTERSIIPESTNYQIYKGYYKIYNTLYENTKKQMHDLSRMADFQKEK